MATILQHPHSSGKPYNRVFLSILHLCEIEADGGDVVTNGGTNISALIQETGLEESVIKDVLSELIRKDLIESSFPVFSLTDKGEDKAKEMRSGRSYF